jgi:hypothetical protein
LSHKVAARFVHAADLRRILTHLFDGTRAYVKDWDRFLRELSGLYTSGNVWSLLPDSPDWVATNFRVTDGTSETIYGKQIPGTGWHEPPEYQEYELEVPTAVEFTLTIEQSVQGFARNLGSDLRSLLSDRAGFTIAVMDLFGNAQAAKLLAKLAANAIQGSFRTGNHERWFGDEDDASDWLSDELDTDMSGTPRLGEVVAKVQRAVLQGQHMVLTLACTADTDIPDAGAPEPDYEPDYDDGY